MLRWLRREKANPDKEDQREDQRELDALTEQLTAFNPRLRLVSRYQQKLGPNVAVALAYVHDVMGGVPPPRTASATAWSGDPYIHAFFATSNDVPLVLGRSEELQAFFHEAPDVDIAYAVLSMEMSERHTMGVGLEGEVMRTDIPQTTISFADHQIRICARSDGELRDAIARKMVEQLAVEGLARTASRRLRREALKQEQALLRTRLQLLEKQGAGLSSMIGGASLPSLAQRTALLHEIEANDEELARLGQDADSLDRQLETLADTLAGASTRLRVENRRMRLSRMNILLAADSAEQGDDVELQLARVPGDPPRDRAFLLVQLQRADAPPPRNALDTAERYL